MNPLTKARALKVAVWSCVSFLILGGLYVAKCWQVKGWTMELYESPTQYSKRLSFWLVPTIAGELHWDLCYLDGRRECIHSWKAMGAGAFIPNPTPEQRKVHDRSCKFALDSKVYGEPGWWLLVR